MLVLFLQCSSSCNTEPSVNVMEAWIITDHLLSERYNADHLIVPITVATRRAICRLQLPRICETENARCFSGTQERDRGEENTRTCSKRIEGVTNAKGASSMTKWRRLEYLCSVVLWQRKPHMSHDVRTDMRKHQNMVMRYLDEPILIQIHRGKLSYHSSTSSIV